MGSWTPMPPVAARSALLLNPWKFAILFFVISSLAVQIAYAKNTEDADLVFDDLQSVTRDTTYTTQTSKHVIDDLSENVEYMDVPIDDVVQDFDDSDDDDIDENPNSPTAVETSNDDDENGNWLVRKVKRIRRQITQFFGGNEENPKTISNSKKEGKLNGRKKARKNVKGQHAFNKDTKINREKLNQKLKEAGERRMKLKNDNGFRPKRQFEDDDEDLLDDDEDNEISGSGHNGHEDRLFRVKFIAKEIWQNEYLDRNSPEYKNLSTEIIAGLERMYEKNILANVDRVGDEKIFPEVIQLTQTRDPFKVLVTADISSAHPMYGHDLDDIIRQEISQFHQVGYISAEIDDNYSFRTLEGYQPPDTHDESDDHGYYTPLPPIFGRTEQPPIVKPITTTASTSLPVDHHHHPSSTGTGCGSHEFMCEDGECIDAKLICDNNYDCEDGTDEYMCENGNGNGYRNANGNGNGNGNGHINGNGNGYNNRNGNGYENRNGNGNRYEHGDEIHHHHGNGNRYEHVEEIHHHHGNGNEIPDHNGNGNEIHGHNGNGDRTDEDNRYDPYGTQPTWTDLDTGPGSSGETEYTNYNSPRPSEHLYNDSTPSYPKYHGLGCRGDDTFRCRSNDEICEVQRCDGSPDCPDGDDELDCETCELNEFQCDETRCIPISQKCDGLSQCNDASDERGCPVRNCHAREYRCHSGHCIREDQRCDGYLHCPDGDDEQHCSETECKRNEFRCNDKITCIHVDQKCDGIKDCPSGNDEQDCASVDPRLKYFCPDGKFTCRDLSCISIIGRCDGKVDCPNDRSDEEDCPCLYNKWQCDDGTCISAELKCNGNIDCPNDISDERNCDEEYECRRDEFRCDSGQCIDKRLQCNYIYDCSDYTDERDCSYRPTTTRMPDKRKCTPDEYECSNGDCIHRSAVCDRHADCAHGEDEAQCHCPEYEFKCLRGGGCIPQSLRCDRVYHCYDGSDEDGCHHHQKNNTHHQNASTSCLINQYQCADGICIAEYKRCNGINDCSDHSDELHCPTTANYDYDDDSYGEVDTSKCAHDEFECDSSMCIKINQRCDGFSDCTDETDEKNCPNTEDGCERDEFQCDGGLCLPNTVRCDGHRHCLDGTDEKNCTQCKINTFHCRNGECISDQLHCNDHRDCQDGSDEEDCNNIAQGCSPHEFTCSNGQCLSRDYVCDGRMDCTDGSDEEHCDHLHPGHDHRRPCRDDEWQCEDRKCINRHYLCDGTPDCDDGSDESRKTCASAPGGGRITPDDCSYEEYFCDDACHPSSIVCNGRIDCLDRKDEENCADNTPTPPTYPYHCPELTCPGTGKCYRFSEKCDSIHDCDDGHDESDCPCKENEFSCYDHQLCINVTLRCDGYYDCKDFSDEQNCFGCHEGQFKCHDGTCVDRSDVCNGRHDCPDGSDEANCQPSARCQPHQFQCLNGQCVNQNARCDGRPDCSDYSDERDCFLDGRACPPNMFRCENGPCIPDAFRCNGHIDCPFDSSDELDCLPTATTQPTQSRPPSPSDPQLNLKTYPNAQTIKERREVVFQCRDEGPTRAKVHWTRPNGRQLPHGFTDINGRLEIPNIRLEDAGEYICEAVDYSTHTYGQRVTVHLTVEKYNVFLDRPPSACDYHQATCMNGECISKSQICDGLPHCSDGSDEHGCSHGHGCNPDQFLCKNSKCVDRVWRCDGENDCGDNSDEESCDPNPTGSPCRYDEFQCRNGQCIPKSFHCDSTNDCQDGSDEVGCVAPVVLQPPVPRVDLTVGSVLNISCRATGVPSPLIVWRLNWGHVPQKCDSTSNDGYGTLTCRNMEVRDSGAYSCEIINTKGRIFVTPDTIVTVLSDEPDVCPSGFFNALAHRKDDCINCFCFGVSNKCKSADLFIYALPPPVTSQNVVGVDIPQSGYGDIRIGEYSGHNLISLRHGVQFRASDIPYTPELPYLTLPDYQGSQLKSYGGYLKYEAMYIGSGRPNNAPDVIIVGSGYSLTHRTQTNIQPNIRNPISVPFTPGSWFKSDGRQASREEIMMALVNLDHVLLKLQYTDATEREIELLHITMDSAAVDDRGLGSASLVEQCQCPPGYSGFSCETCAPGHVRQKGGAWLGNCVPEPTETCHHGTYGDPSRGIPCRRCPCPLPNTENNFAHSCSLGADNDVICHCQRGYTGRRCEQCEPGYHGDPMQPGSRCSLIPVQHCNEYGTLRTRSDGTCECKQNVVGLYCDQCVPNSFHLNEYSYTGCHDCFCMGITKQCSSSDWYRDIVTSRFNGGRAEHGFTLISNYERPTPAGLYVQQRENELTFQGRSDDTAVHYWSLPNKFLGDKINAYGGVLNYTIRYNPLPGGLMSRNNAPDVVIKSANNIVILHHRKGEVLPSGSQSNSIPMIEQAWQSSDGRTINREQLLMALADINAIYLKATYTTVTAEAAISYVSLDTATPSNIGTSRAVEVEQCLCPQGYTGLSCEDCSPGYKRSGSGPNLGYCEPCECFNHSDECDSDTGHCLNCRDNTAGTYCDLCAPGFTGNATYGTTRDCNYAESQGRCDNCDFRGTASCDNRICRCKANVVGDRCDQCRPNTYNLQELSHVGCTECFCSGVTTECYQSHYSREQIPIFVFEDKLTLTNYDGVTQIEEGFEIDIAANEVSHKFNAYSTYYWRLPQRFLGNQVKSYGGNLLFTVETEGYGEYINDQDVILRGNGITLAWARKPGTEKDITVTARLHESDKWSKIERAGLQPATHTDFLTVLSNLDHILIRANNKSPTRLTKIRDIVLDTALETPIPGKAIATDVEVCQCPHGYSGSSCESCAPMFYHDTFDRHGILGSCKPCPCQENGESCHQQSNGHVLCTCRIGYTGDHCEYADRPTDRPPIPTPYPPEVTITVTVSSPSIRIVEIGETISLDCSAHVILTHVPIQVRWFKLNGQLPEMGYEDQGRLHIQNIQVHDAGIYVCQATRGDEIAQQNVTIHVGRPQVPDVIVSPSYIDAEEYNSAEFFCEGMGSPQPYITWSRVGGPLPPSAVVDGPRLTFTSLRRSDEGTYRCLAQNNVGDRDAIVQVVVRPSRVTPTTEYPVPTFAPVPGEVEIEPPYYQGRSGSDVHLNCNYDTRESVEYRWLKDNNVLYGEHIKTYNNLLVIQRASSRDSGQYTCQVVNVRTGYILSGTSTVYIEGGESSERPPQVIPLKNAHSVVQGHDLSIVCEASGSPYPTIKWTKLHENLDSNIRITGNTLLISNAQAANRGVYVCIAESVSGSDQSSTVVDVDPRERPMLEVHPRDPQFVRVGDSAMLSCRAIAGIPEPIITWVRRDGRPLSPRVHEEYRGIISFHDVTAEDAGEYECRAENIAGHVTATAILNIQQSPEIIVIPEKEEIVLTEGDELKLVCMGVGQPAPQVHWDYDQRGAVARYPTYSPEAIIHIYEVRKQDQRVYTCKATSAAGSLQKRVSVIVNSKRGDIGPHDGDSPNLQPYKVGLGDSATLICQIDDSQVRTVWNRIDGRPLPHNAVISGNNLIIENTDWDAAGLYQCSVIDRYGQRPLITAEIQVLPIPRITFSPPMPMVVRSGENVVIYCNATGEEPIRVNWHAENHRPLPHSVSAESNYLRFNYITPADAGRYYCTALNAHGNATKVAEVLVNRGTQVDRPSQSRVHEVFEGDNVALDCGIPQERFEAGFRYNWRRSQGPISPNADFNYNRLILRNIRPEDGGRYICELISPTSGVLSSNYVEVVIKRRRPKYEVYCMVFHFCPANLEVGGGHHHLQPVLTLHPSQSYIRTGESVEVDCSPSDNNYANVVWERSDGSRLPSNVRQIGNKLVITNAQPSDSGDYVCRCVTDLGQEYSSSYELNIEEEAYKRPPRHHKVERAEVGSNVILRCDADHYPASFQWSRQHGKFDSGQVLTTSELRLLNVQASDAGTYICSVSHNAKTVDVPTTLVVTGTIPYFKQNPKSYMTFPKLEGAYMKFNFEVTFRPETLDGLILYNGQKKGSGDYIALSLHDGYPEFRFDFGNNVTIIRSEEPITLGEWHTVKVNRVRKEGFMIVDNQRPVAFPPTQQFIGLDLIENMYIGGVPRWEDIPSTAVAHQIGFIGCVSRLILKDQVVELNRDAIFKEGTTACKPCEGDPCQNDGVCLETQTEMGYSCICQDGFTGKNCAVQGSSCMPGICGVGRCENADFGMECFCPLNKTGNRCQYVEHLDGGSLSFKDGSYAAYKTPKASKLNIKFQIRPDNTEDSVIMYVAESENANGDFAAVLIKDKHVELRLNTGARLKPLVIRSQNPIEAHKWTEIHVSRKLGEGNLKVGDELEQTGKAVGPARSMYLKTYLYLGGYDKRILLNKGVEVTRGFEGCISGLEESSQPVNMVAEILDAANVQSCGDVNEIIQKPHDEYPLSAPCAQDPCENGGTCVPDGSSHRCDCPLGFAGHNCENYYRLDLKAHFRGNGYLEIDHAPFSDSIDQMNSSVALLFSTSSPNGILLWYGQEKGQTYSGNDYLALAVVDGILEYSFRLDGEESSIRTPYTRVDDGHRHVAIIKRSGNHHSLELDNFTYYGESRPTNRKRMHLPGHLFIGGAPNLSNFTGNRYTQGFSGCVHVIEAQDSGPIPLGQRAISGVNVDTCPDDNSDYHDIDLGPEPPVV